MLFMIKTLNNFSFNIKCTQRELFYDVQARNELYRNVMSLANLCFNSIKIININVEY